eukprot:SAG31_NODE_5797_length_2323_cov_3.180842_4_plen_175_part_00
MHHVAPLRQAFDKLLDEGRRALAESRGEIDRDAAGEPIGNASRIGVEWVTAALAAALPLLDGVLPRDGQGSCVVPHPHAMERKEVSEERAGFTMTGCQVYDSGRGCDNCDAYIQDRYYWSCSAGISSWVIEASITKLYRIRLVHPTYETPAPPMLTSRTGTTGRVRQDAPLTSA